MKKMIEKYSEIGAIIIFGGLLLWVLCICERLI